MRRKISILFIVLLLGLAVSGCINQPTTSTITQTKTTTSTITQTETVVKEPHYYPISVKDFANRSITIEKEPKRIVSLAPSITETLYYLGALDKVVGITKFDNFPADVKEGRTVIGGFSDPNIELIASLKPDLIIITSMHYKYLEQLEQIAPVVVVDPGNIDEIYEQLELFGRILNKQGEAEGVINFMKAKIEEIEIKVADKPKVKVFYIVWSNPLMTAGKGSFINDLITLAGGENIFEDVQGWPQVSVEEVLGRDPDVIILPPHAGITREELCKSELSKTSAVRNGRVFVISDDDIVSRPSPRIVEGLEEFARLIHPQAFNYNVNLLVCNVTAG